MNNRGACFFIKSKEDLIALKKSHEDHLSKGIAINLRRAFATDDVLEHLKNATTVDISFIPDG